MNFSTRFRPHLLPLLKSKYQLVLRLLASDIRESIEVYVEALEERIAELKGMKK